VQAATPTTEAVGPGYGHPQVIFFSELDGTELLARLRDGGLAAYLATHGYGVALALYEFTPSLAEAVRVLNQRDVSVVAWLLLPPGEDFWFNLQNYPQAFARYYRFRDWVREHGLRFRAVGLNIAPPGSAIDQLQHGNPRHLARRLLRARDNVLYGAARNAYTDLVSEIRHDGYEVHTYQVPIVADDRRAGSTLAQRVLDIVDIPADVEVLICYSSVPLAALEDDLGGALIASYGPAADGIAVGVVDSAGSRARSIRGLPPLSWEALERDLILAGQFTDTIYVYSLEGCLERGLLPRIAAIDWEVAPRVLAWKRSLVGAVRIALLIGLLLTRLSHTLIAWLGWALFALLLARQLRAALRRHRSL